MNPFLFFELKFSFFILLIINVTLHIANSQIIETELATFYEVIYIKAEMKLGLHTTIHYMTLKQSEGFTVFCDEQYNEALPESSTMMVKINNRGIIVKQSQELVEFLHKDNMNFYVLNLVHKEDYSEYCSENIFLPFKFNNSKVSMVHSLVGQKKISNPSFSVLIKGNNEKGSIFFGGVPENLIKNKYVAKCNVSNQFATWSCDLSKVMIIDKETGDVYHYYTRFRSSFDLGEYKILAPKDFIDFLKLTYFKERLEKGHCNFIPRDTGDYFHCICSFFKQLPDVKFFFSNKEITLNMKQLFESYGKNSNGEDDLCDLYIIPNIGNPKEWVFGVGFLKNYITKFDYEKREVSFYSDIPFDSANIDRGSLLFLKLLYLLLILLLSICSIILRLTKQLKL